MAIFASKKKKTMKRLILSLLMALALLPLGAQSGKAIYMPRELQGIDFHNPDSEWSYHRMALTPNFAIFWQKGFGNDLANPPQLEGHDMHVDLLNLEEKLERFYAFFRDTLQFVKPGSKSERYRMMVMLNYSLEGTAYGGDYDGEIGALWIAPNRVQDERLNCIAHELGHSFQSQVSCDGEGEAWGGCGFFEMTSQWMLWQVNPDWITDERYHWEAFTRLTHKAFLHLENIYHSPFVLEAWGQRHGLPFLAELFRQGKRGEDPAQTYMRMNHLTVSQFHRELFDVYRRCVNWDFPRTWVNTRPYANRWSQPEWLPAGEGWQQISAAQCPEEGGFNVVSIPVPEEDRTVTVEFEGVPIAAGYHTPYPQEAAWLYGLVAVDAEGRATYEPVEVAAKGRVQYTVAAGHRPEHLWLVVMAAPTVYHRYQEPDWDDPDPRPLPCAQWPYKIRIKN
jgi:hypothetical protein